MALSRNPVISTFPASNHNHGQCVSTALASAQTVCSERGARLTRIRHKVLELIWSSHAPVVAYDLLEKLKPEKANATPPTVYRALDFLLAHGLIHRIESMNAYVGCPAPQSPHRGQFLICTSCGTVAELDCQKIEKVITTRATELGFSPSGHTIEISGECAACSQRS